MQIIIPLPNNSSASTYEELKNYFKQFELAVHYAQKSVENAEKEGIELTEDSYVCFKHPSLEKGIESNNYDELQHIELDINLQ